MNLKAAMRMTADYADDADSRTCERHRPPTPLTQWVSGDGYGKRLPIRVIREIRGSISGFRMKVCDTGRA